MKGEGDRTVNPPQFGAFIKTEIIEANDLSVMAFSSNQIFGRANLAA